jgi:GNAT superfamily N-acetyltransferase
MQIRGARPEDCPGIARIQVDSYRSAYAGIGSATYLDALSAEEQEQDWRDWFDAYPEDVLLVAEDDKGRIVGYALGRPESPLPGFDGELIALHVREQNQRMGIGRLLLWTIARELRRGGCSSLMFWIYEDSGAHAFYDRMGAERLEAEQAVDGQPREVARGWPEIAAVFRREA